MEFYLVRKDTHGSTFKIKLDKEEIIVGRKNFPFLNKSIHISRQHASFQVSENGTWFVKDLNSTNGLFVNSVKLGKSLRQLCVGDSIGFGVPHAVSIEEFEFILIAKPKESLAKSKNIAVTDPRVHSSMTNADPQLSRPLKTSLLTCQINSSSKTVHHINFDPNRVHSLTNGSKKLSYKINYANIIGNQPFVVLERCDNSQYINLGSTSQPLKRKNSVSCDSDSSDDCFNKFLNKKKKSRFLLSSSSSDDDPNTNIFIGSCVRKSPSILNSKSSEMIAASPVNINKDIDFCNEQIQQLSEDVVSMQANAERNNNCFKERTNFISSGLGKDPLKTFPVISEVFSCRVSLKSGYSQKPAIVKQEIDSYSVVTPPSTVISNTTIKKESFNDDDNYSSSKDCSVERNIDLINQALDFQNDGNYQNDSVSYSLKTNKVIHTNNILHMKVEKIKNLDVHVDRNSSFVNLKQEVTKHHDTPLENAIEVDQYLYDCESLPYEVNPRIAPSSLKEVQVKKEIASLAFKPLSSAVKNLLYSQEDEVICISSDDDGDNFFDIPLSQVKCEADTYFKQKPDDELPDDYGMEYGNVHPEIGRNDLPSFEYESNITKFGCIPFIEESNDENCVDSALDADHSLKLESCVNIPPEENTKSDEDVYTENITDIKNYIQQFSCNLPKKLEFSDRTIGSGISCKNFVDNDESLSNGQQVIKSSNKIFVPKRKYFDKTSKITMVEERNSSRDNLSSTKSKKWLRSNNKSCDHTSARRQSIVLSSENEKIANNERKAGTDYKKTNETVMTNAKPLDSIPVNDFFPVLSQAMLSSSESSSEASDNEDCQLNKIQKKPGPLLIEAKPMSYRPRYQRGREEWFDDYSTCKRTVTSSLSPKEPPKKPKEYLDDIGKKSRNETSCKTGVSFKRNTINLKKMVQKKMGYCIPMPGGGSAIPSRSKKMKSNYKSKSGDQSYSPKVVIPFRIPKLSKTSVNESDTTSPNRLSEKENAKINDSHIKVKPLSSREAKLCTLRQKEKLNIHCSFNKSAQSTINSSPCPRNFSPNNVHSGTSHESAREGNPYKWVRQEYYPISLTSQEKATSRANNLQKSLSVKKCLSEAPKVSVSNDPISERPLPITNSAKNKEYASRVPEMWQNGVGRTTTSLQKPNIIVPSQRKALLSSPFSFDYILSKVLYWSPKWLDEYTKIGIPPPSISDGAVSVPLTFESIHHYSSTFYPLIMLELWESLYNEWHQYQSKASIYVMFTGYIAKGDIMVLECQSLVLANAHFVPREGNLLRVLVRDNSGKKSITFGYVFQHKVKVVQNSCGLHKEWGRFLVKHSSDMKLYEFSMKIRKCLPTLELNKLSKVCVLGYVGNKLHLANTFRFLYSSTNSLAKDLLKPSMKTFEIPLIKKSLPTSVIGNYNESQTLAIANISAAIMNAPYLVPKVVLLQGPPGTGKTHTIIGIIQNIVHEGNQKILVTAQSNAAVDEIGRRLIMKHEEISVLKLKVVRVGNPNSLHPDVLPCHIDSLVKQNMNSSSHKDKENLKKSCKQKLDTINYLKSTIESMSNNGENVPLIRRKLRELEREQRLYKRLEEQIYHCKHPINQNLAQYKCRQNILRKADVIIATLSGCRLRILEEIFGPKSDIHFTCCIVDEATQCTEPEVLQPLAFGLCKFILVGDHKQLPATVISPLAQQCNYHHSLFERTHKYFQLHFSKTPMYMLNEQYRMQPEIAVFPSQYFYSKQLRSHPSLYTKYKEFPFRPFTMLHVPDSQESDVLSSKENTLEAEVIIDMCKRIVPSIPKNCSVGIITPYQGQRHLYSSALSQHGSTKCIEVNTVDSFQGREKDVIILSCVRAKSVTGSIGFLSCPKRLNVAITRSKQCLIICGHMESLTHNYHWSDLIQNAKQRGLYIEVTSLKDMPFVLQEMKNTKHTSLK